MCESPREGGCLSKAQETSHSLVEYASENFLEQLGLAKVVFIVIHWGPYGRHEGLT